MHPYLWPSSRAGRQLRKFLASFAQSHPRSPDRSCGQRAMRSGSSQSAVVGAALAAGRISEGGGGGGGVEADSVAPSQT